MEEANQAGPFAGKIGLCLSGGGYRAASFHLGALSYLSRRGLADQLNSLSTVSGGTFTGARFALSRIEDKPFSEFFSELYAALESTDLVADGLEALAARKNSVPSGRQDLIVSMAQIYADTLFSHPVDEGKREPYYFDAILEGDVGIENVIFNATDFRSGIAFRFQRSNGNTAKIGNYYNQISPKDAGRIQLADIVAASSCFPGGFEPLSFPYDFTWKDQEIPQAVLAAFPRPSEADDASNPKGPVALMDGGVYDNQGLQSLLLADNRDKDDLDLVIISDVDQPSIELYKMPKPGSNSGPTLGVLGWLSLIAAVMFLVSCLSLGYHAYLDHLRERLDPGRLLFLYLIPAGLSAGAAYAIYKIREIVRDDLLPYIPGLGDRAWVSLSRLTIGQVRNMIKLRATSVLTLTTSVFMKRIRALVYQSIYEDSDQFQGKRVSNLIYTLAPSKTRLVPVVGLAPPSEQLQKVACVAFNMDTTLWFSKAMQAPCLTAAGQASLCYNLIKSIGRRFGDNPDDFSSEVLCEYQALESDWNAFNDDPFFQLKASGVDANWVQVNQQLEAADCHWGMFANDLSNFEDLS